MDNFLYALRAIMPILLIIGLGAVVRRLGSWDTVFFKRLNGLCFHLFLPISLFCNVYAVSELSEMNWKLIGVLILGILASLAMGWVAVQLLVPRRDQKGVVIQASFRANHAILGLPLAEALGGAAAMGFASLTTAVAVPVFNVLAVLVLSCYGDRSRPSGAALAKRVAKNPLIVATLLGVACVLARNLLGIPIPLLQRVPPVYTALQNLAKIASPVMLFVLGACLDFKAVGALLPQVTLGVVLRLIATPALILGVMLALREPLQLTVVEMPAMVAVCASPVAVSSAVMTQEIGGDDQLASQLVVWTSVLSMLTIFVIVCILRSIGAL